MEKSFQIPKPMHQQGSFPTIMQQLSLDLFDAAKIHATQYMGVGDQESSPESSPQSPHTSPRTPIVRLPKRNRKEAFDNRHSELWQLRFSSPELHISCKLAECKQRRCVWCLTPTSFSCTRCQMPLCSEKRKECFEKWHKEPVELV